MLYMDKNAKCSSDKYQLCRKVSKHNTNKTFISDSRKFSQNAEASQIKKSIIK